VNKFNCLFVDYDSDDKESISFLLKKYFKNVDVAKDIKEGIELFKKNKYDIIISDIKTPSMDGLNFAKIVKKEDVEQIFLLMVAKGDEKYCIEGVRYQIDGYILKPVCKRELIKTLNKFSKIIKIKKNFKILESLVDKIFKSQKEGIIVLSNDKEIIYVDKLGKFFLDKVKIDKISNEVVVENRHFQVKIEEFEYGKIYKILDITEFVKESITDELTGIYNRKVLKNIDDSQIGCVLMIDIDHFKRVNDTYGHLVGDKVLRKLARLLKSNIRKDDILIRYGGEEFLIITKLKNREDAYKFAEKLRVIVEKSEFEKVGNITISIGVYCKKNGESLEEMIKKADENLYKAKNLGRNRVV
jgi:diguanylate cyclase (GGDEF)-like protein